MAYKFQVGAAQLSGALVQEGAIAVHNEAGTKVADFSQAGIVSGSGQLQGASLAADGDAVLGGSITVAGDADLNAGLDVAGAASLAATGVLTDIRGTLSVDEAAVFDTTVTVTGESTLAAASFSGVIDANSTSDFQGAMNLQAGITVAGISQLDGAIDANSTSDFAGAMNLQAGITVAAISKLDGAIDANSTSDFQGAMNLQAGITVAGISKLDGAIDANSTSDFAGAMNLQAGITVAGASDLNGTLDASGASSFAAAGVLTDIRGTLSVDEAAIFDSSLSAQSLVSTTTISGGAGLEMGGTVRFDGIADHTLDYSSDGFYVLDDATQLVKLAEFSDLATNMAGEGIAASAGVLAVAVSGAVVIHNDKVGLSGSVAGSGLSYNGSADHLLSLEVDLSELSDGVIAADDFFVFVDETDGATKQDSVEDLAALFAGVGLSAASAVMALDLNELSAVAIDVASDSFAFVDAGDNSTKKSTIALLVADMAGAGLTATNGVLSADGAAAPNGIGNIDADLAEGFNYGTTNLDAARTWTMPAPAELGDTVHVKAPANCSSTFTISIAGATIDGAASVILESPYAAVSLICVDVAGDVWRLY